MKTGLICELKRFAVHDGPGIRTTVFFKGCPLHCLWCHNPESIRCQGELAFWPNKCQNCGECVPVCQNHKIVDGRHRFERGSCLACGKCVQACYYGALFWYGQVNTVKELHSLILADKHFFDHSGGGATFSGGEPLLQAEFCAELARRLQNDGINTAIDTCGEVPWANFERVLPFVDLFLYDFKHADSAQHRKLTGSGNERIMENLRKLSEKGKKLEVRLPLIPGLNDSAENLRAAGQFLSQLKQPCRIRLLLHHDLADSKYQALGITNQMTKTGDRPPERLLEAAEILRGFQLPVIGNGTRVTDCVAMPIAYPKFHDFSVPPPAFLSDSVKTITE